MQLLLKTLVIFALTATFQGISEASQKKWWETASFYQIYPRSFKDSNGDGIGDLKGITEQLDYLKEIGITATWLSPIFTSPMADFGYDITNYTEIDPMFGTMDDFEKLLEKAKSIGIKIILDFVPNHTSDECVWFQLSAANDPYYKDFFVWHPGKMVNGKRQPPTNWISNFRGSQWTWHEGRQEYYLHQFHYKQPDLNYRNPKVVEAMNDVLRFWLRKGVDGFRVDSMPHVFEIAQDESGNLPDEPHNPAASNPEDYNYLQHIYTKNQPETIALIYEYRALLKEMHKELGGDEFVLLTEAYSSLDVLMQYYGNATHDGAQIPFNFELISNLNDKSTAYDYNERIQNWLVRMPKGRSANWVLGNHDNGRIGSRLGIDRIDLINTMLLTLPGCSVTYNGEEIGMTDVWISWKDTVDPQACQSNPQEYERLSRDPARTPFQWNDHKNGGFSVANFTWLPMGYNYKKVNVGRQRNIPMSHLNVYKQLQQLRAHTTMKEGETEVNALSANVLAIKRSLAGQHTFIVLLNLMDNMEQINLNAAFNELSSELEYVLVTEKSSSHKGDKATTDSILLMPYDAVVLRTV